MELTDISDPTSREEVPYQSENQITIQPQDVELTLAVQAFADQVSVFNALTPEEILATDGLTSRDLLLAQIPVGTGGTFDDDPRGIAATNDATRAYVSLRQSGRIAVIDLMSLQQVDTNPETVEVIDPIELPNNASPHAITNSFDDRYAYIGDYQHGTIYVLDIDSRSQTYHQVVQTINLGGADNGIRSLAVSSDGKKLFATAPGGYSPASTGYVYTINIDPEDEPGIDESGNPEPNERNWHQLIGSMEVEKGVEGITTTPDPNVMLFTNRNHDSQGLGRINITNEDPTQFASEVSYTALGLGSSNDYFDVNDARDVVVTSDGKYGFVAGFNGRNFGSGAPSIDGPKAGSNVGIIVDPLTDNAKLIAATRPIPMGLTSGVTLSGDDRYLFASYPGVGGVYAWDVEEMIATIEDPSSYTIDHRGRGVASPVFNPDTAENATSGDLSSVPIDNINPDITIAADLQLTQDKYRFNGSEFVNDVEFGVPNDSTRAPLTIGFNPWSITNASHRDWLDLVSIDGDNVTQDLTPTFEWEFSDGYEDVKEVNLFVSAFPKNEGLLPWDRLVDLSEPTFLPELSLAEKKELLTEPWQGYDDFNPGRVVTATWRKETNTWYWHDGETEIAQTEGNLTNNSTRLTLPDELALTLGQDYYWAVQATTESGEINLEPTGELEVVAPLSDNPFSSVTVLTHGFSFVQSPLDYKGIPRNYYDLADKIAGIHGEDNKGLILRYDDLSGNWIPVEKSGLFTWRDNTDLTNGVEPGEAGYMTILGNKIQNDYKNKPLILLPEWSTNQESTVPDSGFTEAAADAFFASLVELDQKLGGSVGEEVSPGNGIYDESGKLRRKQGDLFNSPMHFVGFSRGTVVNSEIIQRLGTYYPNAAPVDLQMTTIDPHDFVQDNLDIGVGQIITNALSKLSEYTFADAQDVLEYMSKLTGFENETLKYSDFKEPRVQVWDNIDFADNYYQTTNDGSNPINKTPNGRKIENTNRDPYSNSADLNLDLTDFRGFKGLEAILNGGISGTHGAVLAWYAGTIDNALERFDDNFASEAEAIEIENKKGEINVESWYDSSINSASSLWYSSADNNNDYDPEEGIGTGWHYSFLNGEERPNETGSKVTTAFDNTFDPRSRGDFAVPTLFNGNFDASFSGNSESVTNNGVRNIWGGAIPGWSYHNGRLDQFDPDGAGDLRYGISIENLVDWKHIDSLANYRSQAGYSEEQPNFALKMDGGDSIVHNRFVVPDWGALSLKVHVPKPSEPTDQSNFITITLISEDGQRHELKSPLLPPEAQLPFDPQTDSRLYDNPARPAVDLREVSELVIDAASLQSQTNRIGFGRVGFETFQVDIPNDLNHLFRGKSATLEIAVEGNKEVYIDDVFFGSEHLKFGNPELNGQKAIKDEINQPNNYLLEKPQYAVSYNEDTKTPNWVAYQLNQTWNDGSSLERPRRWAADYSLPVPPLTRVEPQGIPGSPLPPDGRKYQRGHMTAKEDRSRSTLSYYPNQDGNPYTIKKDHDLTFLMTNAEPQIVIEGFTNPWDKLEDYLLNTVVKNQGKEAYIIAGRDGQDNTVPLLPETDDGYQVSVPSHVWKVVLVMDKPGLGIQDVTENTVAFAVDIPNTDFTAGVPWTDYVVSINDLEDATGYDFLSNIPKEIQESIEDNENYLSASLMAEIENFSSSSTVPGTDFETSIWHSSIPEKNTISLQNVYIPGFNQISPNQIGSAQFSIGQIGSSQTSLAQIGSSQIGSSQTSPFQTGIGEVSINQIGVSELGLNQSGTDQISADQTRIAQINPTQMPTIEIGSHQINASKVSSFERQTTTKEFNSNKGSFSSSIEFEQFFPSNSSSETTSVLFVHNSSSEIINVLNNSATNIWSDLLQSPTQLDIDFQITDLPTGQLAEATITSFNNLGVPNAGTIAIDYNANGVGWFIDPTPLDNSEFSVVGDKEDKEDREDKGETYLLATAESEAIGKYDLLTTVLHELAHLYGFIEGYAGFDVNVETKNGTTKFIGDDFEAVLDGEHLDKIAHPYDLMNTHLAPGIRKLPSELNVQILQAILGNEDEVTRRLGDGEKLDAALSSDPLFAISNGDFSISDTTTDSFGWDTRGASGIESGRAILTENSPFLSNFSQTFTVPTEAKTIQFKLIETKLGTLSASPASPASPMPPDAFEVALLDANTRESLVSHNDLTQTDSLLNIQNNGTAYFSNNVRIGGATSGEIIELNKSHTITVDISHLTPGTEATLYFDLLGFGDADSRIVIDDVRLSDQFLLPPVANNDTATTIQGQPVVIDILANDRDEDGTIAVNSILIQNQPHHGLAITRPDGTVSYISGTGFVGTDSFTYVVQDNDGQFSEPATVEVKVENAIPEIVELQLPDTIAEGVQVNFGAIAFDGGNDELTYTWDFGDDREVITTPLP